MPIIPEGESYTPFARGGSWEQIQEILTSDLQPENEDHPAAWTDWPGETRDSLQKIASGELAEGEYTLPGGVRIYQTETGNYSLLVYRQNAMQGPNENK